MSYEGYSQFLCRRGHNWEEDCNFVNSNSKCPICGDPYVWENTVDQTNGSFEGDKRIDGYINLKVDKEKKCKECGHTIFVTYKIPKKGKS